MRPGEGVAGRTIIAGSALVLVFSVRVLTVAGFLEALPSQEIAANLRGFLAFRLDRRFPTQFSGGSRG